jgi:hypothetical protein
MDSHQLHSFSLRSLIVAAALPVVMAALPSAAQAQSVYRCWQMNAGGAGGYCRTSPPIVFNSDGTYQESSRRGRYSVTGDRVTMSGSTVRGPGRIAGNNIVFHYNYQNLDYTVTYLLQSGSPLSAGRSSDGGGGGTTTSRNDGNRITVGLTIRFPRSDGSLGWMSTVILTPEGQPPARPTKFLQQDAIADRKTWSVHARFDPPLNAVPAGRVYDVWVDTGMEKRRIGKIDLSSVTSDVDLTIDAHTVERR